MMSYRFASVLLCLLLPLEASSDETANLTVRVQGVTPGQGEVEVTLFSDEESWMENAAQVLREPVGDEAWVDVLVPGLAPGDYALDVTIVDAEGQPAGDASCSASVMAGRAVQAACTALP